MSDLGFAHELANYGEYSGAPNDEQTFAYARTILGLMTRNKDPRGKVLIIGGGIANFTDVAATFKGIIQAIKHYAEEIRDGNIKIYVRRAGPNYQEGLRMMKVRARARAEREESLSRAWGSRAHRSGRGGVWSRRRRWRRI